MIQTEKPSEKNWGLRILIFLLGSGLLIGAVIAYSYYNIVYAPNTKVEAGDKAFLYVPPGSELSDVLDSLKKSGFLKDHSAFAWVAKKKNLVNHIYPGKYPILPRENNNSLANMLRSGSHIPVKVTFNAAWTKEILSGIVTRNIYADSLDVLNLLNNDELLDPMGFTPETAISLFIPDTYLLNWATTAESLIKRMNKEYQKFWNEDRIQKAEDIGLSPQQVGTLASIVQCETNKADEMSRIAGVYMNRLRIGMALEADPTLKFALGDFTIRRVLNVHKEIDSPYNTYKYPGLPPGPICLVRPEYLDAVLNYEDHEYLFFCAREDFSGYSNFAKTYPQHLRNAKRYQEALNREGIYR